MIHQRLRRIAPSDGRGWGGGFVGDGVEVFMSSKKHSRFQDFHRLASIDSLSNALGKDLPDALANFLVTPPGQGAVSQHNNRATGDQSSDVP